MEDTLLVRSLEITRLLMNSGSPFILNIKLASGFSYSLDTTEERISPS
jgi:hypothetical protein